MVDLRENAVSSQRPVG